MEETLVTFETALLAKEKGFSWATTYEYGKDECFYSRDYIPHDYNIRGLISAPTQSLLQKWLREVHKINVESYYLPNAEKYASHAVPMNIIKPKHYNFVGECYNARKKYLSKNRFNTYEEALEEGLINGLNQL